ncbi:MULTISPECIES: GFA family protein [Thioclava]|uniref:GFA family protein n=1 Tax=Thioclava TaxID=285107 RepID=UPI000C3F2DB6|nr:MULTISPECIES: GFA family protein [Thioclava]MAQ38337.1 aldehyde-activating protein [Thioclava sp.]
MLPEIQSPHRLTCHCGAVEMEVTLSDGLSTKRRCDCSFCRRRGAVAVSAPLSGILIVKGENNLTLYQFGTMTAKHYFCKTCGIYTHHQRRSNPNQYGVNAACLEGVNPRDLDPAPWNDGVNHPTDRAD